MFYLSNEERSSNISEELFNNWNDNEIHATTISISHEYVKDLQIICRAFNEGIKSSDKEKIIYNIQLIVNWFLAEKDEDKLNQIIEVLGKISKHNIELIAPVIDMFLKMVDRPDEDKIFRAIKGLGEVTVQRPGWANTSILKLLEIGKSHINEWARMKALIELSRIARSNPTMLIEYIEKILHTIKDPNKHIRRLTYIIFRILLEAIPRKVWEEIPAIKKALNDDDLVRLFGRRYFEDLF